MSAAALSLPVRPLPETFDAQAHCASCKYPLAIDAVVQTACSHYFHRSCCKGDLRQQRTCPVPACNEPLYAYLVLGQGSGEGACRNDGPQAHDRLQVKYQDIPCELCTETVEHRLLEGTCSHTFHIRCFLDLTKDKVHALARELMNDPRYQKEARFFEITTADGTKLKPLKEEQKQARNLSFAIEDAKYIVTDSCFNKLTNKLHEVIQQESGDLKYWLAEILEMAEAIYPHSADALVVASCPNREEIVPQWQEKIGEWKALIQEYKQKLEATATICPIDQQDTKEKTCFPLNGNELRQRLGLPTIEKESIFVQREEPPPFAPVPAFHPAHHGAIHHGFHHHHVPAHPPSPHLNEDPFEHADPMVALLGRLLGGVFNWCDEGCNIPVYVYPLIVVALIIARVAIAVFFGI